MTDAKAEAEILELIRHEKVQNFTLSISVREGRWTVATEVHDAGVSARGHGERFAEAWFDQSGPELRD